MKKRSQQEEGDIVVDGQEQKKLKSGDAYVVIEFNAEDVVATRNFRIPVELVDVKLLDALKCIQNEIYDADSPDADFRRACKLITLRLDELEEYEVKADKLFYQDKTTGQILGVFWFGIAQQ